MRSSLALLSQLQCAGISAEHCRDAGQSRLLNPIHQGSFYIHREIFIRCEEAG